MEEYFENGHAESVPEADLEKSHQATNTTMKLREVFDVSTKSASGVSLNDTLLVGPTVHSPLLDVLLRFRLHHVALTTNVSRMYRAVELVPSHQDLHRFIWRRRPDEPLCDCHMTQVTSGVSASSFATNMSVKQNAQDFPLEYPQAAVVLREIILRG